MKFWIVEHDTRGILMGLDADGPRWSQVHTRYRAKAFHKISEAGAAVIECATRQRGGHPTEYAIRLIDTERRRV